MSVGLIGHHFSSKDEKAFSARRAEKCCLHTAQLLIGGGAVKPLRKGLRGPPVEPASQPLEALTTPEGPSDKKHL